MEAQQTQRDLASYIGKILRDHFGRGPETVFCSIQDPFITIYLRNFLSPMERILLQENQEIVIHTSRDILMKNLIPEITAYISVLTGIEIEEFFYDWNLHNQSGMFVAISPNKRGLEKIVNEDFFGKDALHEEIKNIGQQAQKVPEEVYSVKINERTIIVVRKGIFLTIERELVRMGQRDILRTAKRRVEKRLMHNNMRLESIFDAKINDSFVSWSFDRDKSVMLFIINPYQHGGNELDK